MAKLTNDEFDGLVDHEIQQAVWWQESAISSDRAKNYQRYLGLPLGNEVEGRSQVVSWDVFETIESVMPDLLEVFLAGDDVGEFEPTSIEDEAFAQQATDYINHIIRKQNRGFLLFNTWFKDALLAKLGIVRPFWNTSTQVKKEEYTGVDAESLTMMLEDSNVEVVEQLEYPDPEDESHRAEAYLKAQAMPEMQATQMLAQLEQTPPRMLYDVTIKVTREKGQVCIDNIKPESFIISKNATKQEDAVIQGELRAFTRSDLVSELGVSKAVAFAVQDYDHSKVDGGSAIKELLDGETAVDGSEPSIDKSMEEVILFSGFVRADYDGDGVAEWRYVLRGGNGTLKNEEADAPDYCLLTPIPIPHSIYGLALADPVGSIADINTALTRQYIDSLFLANNPRTYAVDGQVNLDDLLNNRIGGVVRMKQQNAAGPMETVNVSGEALQGIEFMDSRREARTGVTRYNQGLDADSLNKTAFGVKTITSKGDKRTLMIARIFAETGVSDLFKAVLKLVCMHQDHEATIRLRNKWVSFDPRSWSHEMDVTVNVGLGTGDKSEQIQLWQNIIQMQKDAIASGSSLADEASIYKALQQLMKAMGVRGAELYFKDPADAKPRPKQDNPMVEVEKIKQAGLAQKFQAEQIIEQQKAEAQKEQEYLRSQNDITIEREKIAAEMELERYKAELKAETDYKIALMQMNLQAPQMPMEGFNGQAY